MDWQFSLSLLPTPPPACLLCFYSLIFGDCLTVVYYYLYCYLNRAFAEHDSGYQNVGHRAGGHLAVPGVLSEDDLWQYSDGSAAVEPRLFLVDIAIIVFGCLRQQPVHRPSTRQSSCIPTRVSIYVPASDEILPCFHRQLGTTTKGKGKR